MMLDFVAWPKIPRLLKRMVVTEKIDGTNAAVTIEKLGLPGSAAELARMADQGAPDRCSLSTFLGSPGDGKYPAKLFAYDDQLFVLGAQSRNRLIFPGQDNNGFAAWAFENYLDIFRLLGVGRHYGEWWGSGIQRGYGLTGGEKVFSLFNRHRYGELVRLERAGVTGQIRLVPELAEGPFDLDDVRHILAELRKNGSTAAPGYMYPEGVVIFHEASRQVYKAFVDDLDGPTKPKSLSLDAVRSELIDESQPRLSDIRRVTEGQYNELSDEQKTAWFNALAASPRGHA